jgi:hyperosmotically inducible periplasmic protein
MKTPLILLICGIGMAGCNQKSDVSQTPPPAASSTSVNDTTAAPATQPDNTAINSRDNTPGAITAGAQGQAKSDVDITADIRRRLMDGKMSITAQNVKVVCQSGKVTLRGPVNSQDEKDSIGHMANDVAGPDNVDNELEIKPNG